MRDVSIASGAGRVLLASPSTVTATVEVVEAASGSTAAATTVVAKDQGMRVGASFNGIPIGALVSAAVNASSAGVDKRIGLMSKAFLDQTVRAFGGRPK